MKIAFNPSTVEALIAPPNNKDITFDLRGHNIFARGVKFCGTDTNTWRDIKINNVSIDSNILDLRDGDNTTLTNINGVVTINSTWRPVVDNLTSDSTTSSLSANQGRILKTLIDGKSDSGHTHDDRYVKKTGDTMFGALNFANGTWNLVGDDSYMGDCNISGHFGIKAANTTYPGIAFFNNANAHLGNLTAYNGNIKYGAYSLQFLDNGNTSVSASTWMNPFSDYNSNAVADGQAICVWGQSSYLSNLATDTGDISLWLKRVNTNVATLNMVLDGEYYANGNQRLAHVSEIPTSLKNPYALTISLNGTSQGPYDGSAAKNINITPSSIGAATSDHNHDGRYVYNYGGTQMDGASINKNALGMTTNSGITEDWWHILQAAWNGEYRWNSQIAFPTQNRNGMYYRSGLDDNTKWGSWVKLLDIGNSYVTEGKGVINGTTITQVDNATNADKVDNYHIADESRQVYRNYYTVASPAGAWILIKLPAWNANNEIVAIDGYGDNRQSHCVVHCGSRYQGLWGYQSEYNGIVVTKIRWKEVDSGKFAIVALIDGGINNLSIKSTSSLEISKTTEDNAAFAISSSFFSSGGVFYGNAASATKLQTPRTLWYRNTFDGANDVNGVLCINTSNASGNFDEGIRILNKKNGWVSITMCGTDAGDSLNGTSNNTWAICNENGNFYITKRGSSSGQMLLGMTSNKFRIAIEDSLNGGIASSLVNYSNNSPYGLLTRIYNSGCVSLQSQRESSNSEVFSLSLNPLGGNVGIGTISPQYKLTVDGVGGNCVPIQLVNASRDDSWVCNAAFFAPNLTNNHNNTITIGKNYGARNAFGLTHIHIGDGSVNNYAALEVWGVGNVQRWYYDRHSSFLHRADFSSLGSDASYMNSALQIREHGYNGTQADTWANAPRMSWHWSGRVQTQIGLGSNNELYLSKDNFSNAYKLVYETGTWGINISGSASKVYGQVGDTGSHELVRCDMNNDQFRIIAGSNGNNNGWAEIATADDGNEPIYVRQYTGVFSSVRRTLTLLDGSGNTTFPGSLSIGGQIIREGHSAMWIYGRDVALLRETTAPGYHTLWSLKTTNGSWDFGEYNTSGWNNVPVLSYITDSNYNSGNNATTYQIKFPLASGTVALTSYGGDNSHPIFLGYLNLDHGNDGTVSSSFYCLGYSVPFTYTRGGNYCRIYIPDTSYQTFYIRAAIASVNYSGGGMNTWVGDHRNAGAWWLHCYASGLNEVRVKGFCQRNSNNDSWWGGNPLWSDSSGANKITVCIFGNVTIR